jgi:hypothetical protein
MLAARFTLLLLALVLGAGCATPRFDVRIRHAGAYDPSKDQEVEARARAMPWHAEYPVEVHVDQVPEGLELVDGLLTVKPEAAARYQILGQVESAHATSGVAAYAASTWWYYPMHERHSAARDTFCRVQLPLRLLTLGIWSLVSPTSWPCQIVYSTDERENLTVHVQELKRAASALGANVVVGHLESETQVAGSYHSVQSYRVGGVRLSGFAVLDRRREAPPPAE